MLKLRQFFTLRHIENCTMTDTIITTKQPDTYAGSISRTGFSLYTLELAHGLLDDLPALLEQKIAPNHEAYRDRSFVLDVSNVSFSELETLDFESLRSLCLQHDIYLIGLSGVTTEERAALLAKKKAPIVNSNLAMRVREENLKPKVVVERVEVKVPVEVLGNTPLTVISRTVHSGETISAPDNSIVIFGSIGPGARVIASHHIIVFGDIKGGEVYAGSPRNAADPGYPEAFIYASGQFNPSLVSIAGNYQTAEDMESDPLIGPLQGKDVKVVVSLEGTSLRYWQAEEFSPKKATRRYQPI